MGRLAPHSRSPCGTVLLCHEKYLHLPHHTVDIMVSHPLQQRIKSWGHPSVESGDNTVLSRAAAIPPHPPWNREHVYVPGIQAARTQSPEGPFPSPTSPSSPSPQTNPDSTSNYNATSYLRRGHKSSRVPTCNHHFLQKQTTCSPCASKIQLPPDDLLPAAQPKQGIARGTQKSRGHAERRTIPDAAD